MEDLYDWLLQSVLSRVGKKELQRRKRMEKAAKMRVNLAQLSEEMQEYNSVKVVAQRQAQDRLLQSL